MIILWGAVSMIIKRLELKGLHGIYNYNVVFNEDLTFLYGENGCGKTTILDIVSSIVTGKLYNLFRYKFEEVTLSYRENKRSKLNKIRIKAYEDKYELSLNGDELLEIIETPRKINEIYSRDEDEYTFERRFMSMYNFPQFLRHTFNYIYLPLSRNSQDGIDIMDTPYRRHRAMAFQDRDLTNKNYLNESLRYVEEIVRTGCMRISAAENRINEQFKSSLFTSSLKITNEYSLKTLLSSIDTSDLGGIEQNQNEYTRTLQSIGEWNNDTQKRVEDFFKKYKTVFEGAKRDKDEGQHGLTVEFLVMNMEFNRIKEIATQAQRIEAERERIKTPITSFVSTVNNFFSFTEDRKRVRIDSEEGRIYIEADSPHRLLSLYNLSSGEKQIIIIFACLIFGLPVGKSGIYIIDEPEASLHLAWQKKFVEAIREVNSSIQLVFATHAPEIVGKYADHAVKLQRKISPKVLEKEEMHNE